MAKHIPHLFLSIDEIKNNILSDDSFHHLIKVLRLKEQDIFFALDNLGNKFKCIINKINKNNSEYFIIETTIGEKNNLSITLIQAITKIETFEEIIDKSTQLGVNKIFPLVTKNVSTQLSLFSKKIERFNKIIKSSSEQSQRFFLPTFEEIIDLKKFTDLFSPENTIIAYENSNIPMKNVLVDFKHNSINVVCGTEGGFSEDEIKSLSEYSLVSLGKNILRAETASITLLGNIIYQLS